MTMPTCPECRHATTLVMVATASVVAEYVVEHATLSGNRFDPATVRVVAAPGTSDAELARIACVLRAEHFTDDEVQPDDLRARQTRKREQRAERVVGCTICTYETTT